MYQTIDLSESEDELNTEPGNIAKVEDFDYNDLPYENVYSGHIVDNGASSSGTNVRSSLLGMGFSPALVDKAIKQNGEDNMDILLEALFAYSALETSKTKSLHPANGSAWDKEELGGDSEKRKAVLKSHSESSDSLDSLFGDEKDTSSRSNDPAIGHLKEELDESCDVIEDKKASLLMMNFTVEEVDFAMAKLGEDAPVNELVDFIFAAQMANADDLSNSRETKNEEVSTETLFGTMDKTLRLLEIGFSEQEISAAIEKYGTEVSISELAEAIVVDRMAGPCIKTEEDPFSSFNSNSWMAGSKFKSSFMGAEKVLDASFYSNLALRTEERSRSAASQIRDFDMESFTGKPKEECEDEPVSLKRPKPENDYDLSSPAPACSVSKPPVGSKVLQRQLKYKAKRMAANAAPKLSQAVSCASVDQMVSKAPLFFYGNVMNLSQDSWVKISQFLYAIEPEFVNTQFFSALSRKEGYIHNLPTENRFHILPKPPMTIEEALPQIKKYWPSWDTRKQLSSISSETIGISQLCDRLRRVLIDSKGLLSVAQQTDILHQCRSLNLMWVDHNRLAPIEPESVERILGYPLHHTRAEGFSLGERLQSLKHSFQTDALGYHLSVLKSMFPEGLTVLSIYSGVGGAEITLNRLGIRLKAVVSVEPSETKRKILRRWWDASDQTGSLEQIENIQKLSSTKLETLIRKYGVFDFIICQNPYTYSPKSVTMAAAEAESFVGLDFTLFYEFVRVLQRVRSAIKSR